MTYERPPGAPGTMGSMGGTQRKVATPGRALREHRLTLLFTSWPWLSLAYLLTTPLIALAWVLTCWPLLPLAGVPLGRVERWRLRWIDLHPTPSPHTPAPSNGFWPWVQHRLGERITWAELLYGIVLIPLSLVGFTVMTIGLLLPAALAGASGLLTALLALGVDPRTVDPTSEPIHENPIAQVGFFLLGILLLLAGMYLVTLAAEGQRYLTRTLISEPGAELAERMLDLTQSRARITTAFDDERRRIERDLHDGAQQRLTALVMTLGAMRYQHDRGSDITPFIEQARADAQQAVTELRDIVHGIYPAALRDHDLTDALDELVARTDNHELTASAFIDLPTSLPTEVEVGLYFAASELFTNVTKHANATMLTLLALHTPDGTVFLTVEDDGSGGARPDGTGLLGVIDRIETLGGRVTINSPTGGPTRITLEVPCASS